MKDALGNAFGFLVASVVWAFFAVVQAAFLVAPFFLIAAAVKFLFFP